MKKKGFTLVEMLAVIAILGLLVILVVPNILKNYRDAKKVAFIDEAKTVYSKTTDKYVLERTKGHKIGYISNDKDPLSLTNADDLKYMVRIDSDGKVTSFRMTNKDFCIVGVGDFLNGYSKEDVIEMTDEDAAEKCKQVEIAEGEVLEIVFGKDLGTTGAYSPERIYLHYGKGWSGSKGKNIVPIDSVDVPAKANNYYEGAYVKNIDGAVIRLLSCTGKILPGNDGGGVFVGNEEKFSVVARSKFVQKFYKLRFNIETGVTFEETEVVCKYGATDCKIPDVSATRKGFKFLGWTKTQGSTTVDFVKGQALPMINDQNEYTSEVSYFRFSNEDVCARQTPENPSPDNSRNLYPVWEENKYTVVFNGNGSNSGSMSNQTFKYTEKKHLTTNAFGRTGYTFQGWATSASSTTVAYLDGAEVEGLTEVSDGIVNLYAVWKPNVYTITLDKQNGASTEKIYEKYNSGFYSDAGVTANITKVTKPIKEGYTFGGYYTLTNGGGNPIIDKDGNILIEPTTITSDKTIFAHWYYTSFVTGAEILAKMTSLAGSTANIKSFVKSSTLKSGLGNGNVVSTPDSKYKIYMWYENNAIKYYSDDPILYLNPSSNTMFNGLYNLTDISGLASVNTSKVITMESMFQDCASLNNIEPLRNWDVSHVKNLHDFFNIKDAMIENKGLLGSLTTLEPLSNWKTGSVETLEEFVQDHPNITSYHGLEDWDVSNVKTLYSAFGISQKGFNAGAESKLTSISALSGWDVRKVESMQNMLRHSHLITNLDALSGWQTNRLNNMKQTFAYMYSLQNVNGLLEWDTEDVTTMEGLFTSCYSLTDISGLRKWKVNKVKTFKYLFNINDKTVEKYGVYGHISSLAPLSGWHTDAAEDMQGMFQDQLAFTSLNGVQQFTTNHVNNMSSIFGTSGKSRAKGFSCRITDKNLVNGWVTNSTTSSQLTDALNKCSN